MTLFDMPEPEPVDIPVRLSATARRTMKQKATLAAGRHPATGQPLADTGATCRSCAHHHGYNIRVSGPKRLVHKCDLHTLGESHSEASDIRESWPACTMWEPVQP